MNNHDSEHDSIQSAGPKLTRRSALAAALSFGVMPSAVSSLGRPRSQEDSDVVDVLVVGGGVSGCYAAWRIAEASPGSRVEVHERSERIGGRLWSVKPTGMKEQVAELGGMRIASNQTPLLSLVSELGLTMSPYPATEGNDIYYLRGIRSRASELVAGSKYGYRVRKDLEGKTMNELFDMVVKQATGKLNWTRDELRNMVGKVRFEGELLHDLPYRLVFNKVLGHEGTRMLLESMGYGRPNTNAAIFLKEAVLDLFIKGYSHVDGGYQKVPLGLADRARKKGVKFNFGHEMIDLRVDGDVSTVVFRSADGQEHARKARKVILTLPTSAYRLLPDTCALRGKNDLTRMLDNLLPVPATKIYVNFPRQWWNDLGIKSGRSITDLPVRQVFYLDDPSGRGLSLSPYAAGTNDSGYWSPLLPEGHKADGDTLVAKTIRTQLQKMHGIDVPKPSEILYRTFQGGKVGYGWNMWRPGVEPTKYAQAARQPIPGKDVYCVGQATSIVQGWVMDTLSTTESVLRNNFGLARPAWWPESYIPD